MFISKELIDNFSKAYRNEQSVVCYAGSQSFGGPSNKVIMVMDEEILYLIFLNVTLTKVIHVTEIKRDSLSEESIKNSGFSLSVTWRFKVSHTKWRFIIMKKILTLGDMQREFIDKISH